MQLSLEHLGREEFKEKEVDLKKEDVNRYLEDKLYAELDIPKSKLSALINMIYSTINKTPKYFQKGYDKVVEDQIKLLSAKAEEMGLDNFKALSSRFTKNSVQNKKAKDISNLNQTKEYMETIIYLFEDLRKKNPDELVKYKDETFACTEGTLNNLQSIVQKLTSGKGIDEYVKKTKNQIIEDIAGYMLNKRKEDVISSNIPTSLRNYIIGHTDIYHNHIIHSLKNLVADKYGLNKISKETDKYLIDSFYSDNEKRIIIGNFDNTLKTYEVDSFCQKIADEIYNSYPELSKISLPGNNFENVGNIVDNMAEDLTLDLSLNFFAKLDYDTYQILGMKKNIPKILKNVVKLSLIEKGVIHCTEKEKEFVENILKLENHAIEIDELTPDLLDYAVKHNIKFEKTDEITLDGVMDKYFTSTDPQEKEKLNKQYRLLAQGELLGVKSELGQFLEDSKNIKLLSFILNNNAPEQGEQGEQGKFKLDYTKCDLQLLEKLSIASDKLENKKPRDYDTFSNKQKIMFACSTILPIIGNLITYYAISKYNESKKEELPLKFEEKLPELKEKINSMGDELMGVSNEKANIDQPHSKLSEKFSKGENFVKNILKSNEATFHSR